MLHDPEENKPSLEENILFKIPFGDETEESFLILREIEWRGQSTYDLRLWYPDSSLVLVPSRKGIFFSKSEFLSLCSLLSPFTTGTCERMENS